jgi:isoleucyl-tRNA synthetase
MYANIDHWSSERSLAERSGALSKDSSERAKANILDRWLISELHQLIKDVDDEMENYHLMQATRKFVPFVDNLSNWYIRRSRKRFWKSENDGDKNEAYATLHYVLVELSKTIAPFAPYLADEIYKNLTNEESVHLADFPVAEDGLIDTPVCIEMKTAREIITMGLKIRASSGIKVRQPLGELRINNNNLDSTILDIIKEELNIKTVTLTDDFSDIRSKDDWHKSVTIHVGVGEKKASSVDVALNLKITPELKAEGQARELIRAIQQMRKEADYQLDDRIKIGYSGLKNVFSKFGDLIAKETLADTITAKELPASDLEKKITIDNNKTTLWIKK